MKKHEPPNEYFVRGSVLRSHLALHGVAFSDVDANNFFARNIFRVFRVQKSFSLSNAELTSKVLEDVVISAHGEM